MYTHALRVKSRALGKPVGHWADPVNARNQCTDRNRRRAFRQPSR